MKLKSIFPMLAFLLLLTSATGFQPKIVEMSDNFGNTWEFNVSEEDQSARAHSDQEIVVSDETEITLCVTEVRKEDGDEIDFSFNSLQESIVGDHPDDSIWEGSGNCNTWDMKESDYQPSWGYRVKIRNQDDIDWQNRGSDFKVDVGYSNLVRETTDGTQIDGYNFDSVKLSQTEFQNLKSKEAELENKEQSLNNLEEEIDQKDVEISQLTDLVEQQNETIQNLEGELNQKQDRIEELESIVENLRSGFSGIMVSLLG